ncbi:ABC transporter permease [Candidatus Bipolaricaulota bacterium]|nr:ABC transporter permease [Candidatus Bipolaricaulota bacterium]MCK4598233.1 ABC transporter permease [Candidatus Bipolaricaulota bacterium]
MFAYIVRRIAQSFIVLLAVSLICFAIFQFMGDPVLTLAGRYATQEQQEMVRRSLGLDKPFYTQYLAFLGNAAHGDFGLSYVTQVPVLRLIFERLPASIELAVTAMFLSLFLGIALGVVSSLKPHSPGSRVIMTGSLFGISLPTFLVGILLILIFAVLLRVLPPFGRGRVVKVVGNWRTGFLTIDGLRHLILPALTLGMYQLAVLLRLTRGGMLEALQEDYTRTAWAKGLSQRIVMFKHALRNVLIPVVTIAGLQMGELIAFSIVTESIFQWPGSGNLLLTSIYETDHPVIVAYVMITALIVLTINIFIDILYGILNPKISYD